MKEDLDIDSFLGICDLLELGVKQYSENLEII